MTFTPLQSPIPIATVNPPDGAEVIVSGWGRILFVSNALPSRLQVLRKEIMNNTMCQEIRETNVIDYVHLCTVNIYGSAVCSVSNIELSKIGLSNRNPLDLIILPG